jgi:uroporphyrin-III C-methyltransferase/precorrin-2 dehydrogenase/sirohydrochlorin ferrochelatase
MSGDCRDRDEALNQRVSAAANARYRLVNVVDNQAVLVCFPFIVDRSPLLWRSPPAVKHRCCRAAARKNRSAAADQPRALANGQLLAQPSENPSDDHRSARRFWERVFNGRFASLMIAGNKAAAEKALEDELDKPEKRRVKSFWSAPGRAMPGC